MECPNAGALVLMWKCQGNVNGTAASGYALVTLGPSLHRSMKLYLSSRSPINSVFTNEDGQAIYKVETPMTMKRVATITRVIPNDIVPQDGEAADPDMKDRYAFMASVEFNHLSSTRITLVGSEFTTNSYFTREGWTSCGR